MVRVLASMLAVMVGFSVWAEDKKEEKQQLKGAWVREAEGIEIEFNFKTKDELHVVVTAGDNGVTLICKYTVDKDNKVKATVSDVKEKGEFPAKPPKGYEFSCVFKIEKDIAKVTDFQAENADEARAIVEGEYKAKKSD